MSDNPGRVWDFTAALNAIQSTPKSSYNLVWDDSNILSPPTLSQSISTDAENSCDSSDSSNASAPLSLGNFDKVFGFLDTTAGAKRDVFTVASIDGTHDVKTVDDAGQNISWLSQLRAGHVGKPDANAIISPGQPISWLSQLRQGRIGKRETHEQGSKQGNRQNHAGHKGAKSVMFLDDVFAVPDKGHYSDSDDQDEFDLSHLSKKARKKERRRLRHLAAGDKLEGAHGDATRTNGIAKRLFHATSDADTDAEVKLAILQSQTRRDVIKELLTPTKKPTTAKKPISAHDLFLHRVAENYGTDSNNIPARSSPARGPRGLDKASSGSQVDLNEVFRKKTELLQLLAKNFPDENVTLSRMRPVSSSAYDEPLDLDVSGIHVFVDMSNILIGFHNAIKVTRGISINARIPRQKLSFYNFSLILERGRPVAKKCLAGSDNLESVEEAVKLGYENNFLDRVLKSKKMTARQSYFAERDRAKRAGADKSGASSGGEGYLSGFGSGADQAYEPVKKYVEQGVDEILHLKMMQSLVDSDTPGTMVLATGDAAEAEFSDGFLAMCERVLKKGWKVELVSFKANMSYEYRRKDWIDRWNGNFRIIFLDDYAEMLQL